MTINKFIKKLHLWIGLPGAVIFFFICITGSLFVFADEVMDLAARQYAAVNQTGKEWVPVEQMIGNIEKAYPNHRITYLSVDKAENSSMKFLIMGREGLTDVFVNPYDGTIIGESSVAQFFYILAHLHGMLLWHGPGGWIVKIATILFLLALVSGLIIWWPKRKDKKSIKNAFTYKTNRPFKRRIFDLHRVWGFYGSGILLLLTITALILAFAPLSSMVSRMAGGDPDLDFKVVYPADTTLTTADIRPVIQRYLKQPEVEQVQISFFFINQSAVYRLLTGTRVGIITFNGSAFLIDQYTGNEVKNNGIIKSMESTNMLLRLHTGKYLGWVGLILTFAGGLLGAFLAVSGVLLWLQKF